MNGKTFKELREKHGYSRKEIANRLYVGESMVQSWEEGWSLINPSSGEIEELAEIFSMEEDQLRMLLEQDEDDDDDYDTPLTFIDVVDSGVRWIGHIKCEADKRRK